MRCVMGQARTTNHGMNAIAIATSVGQTLQHHNADPFGRHDAVVLGIEHIARLGRRQIVRDPQCVERVAAHAALTGRTDHQIVVAADQHVAADRNGIEGRSRSAIDGHGTAG